jgi:hypothetical protein
MKSLVGTTTTVKAGRRTRSDQNGNEVLMERLTVAVGAGVALVLIWELGEWGAGIILAGPTGGGSLVGAGALP